MIGSKRIWRGDGRFDVAQNGVVIIGAGLCGGNAAVTLREEGYRERIVLIGDEPEAPFGRPPLSKTYLRGEEDLSGWMVKPGDWYADNDVERLHTRVTAVDTPSHQVTLSGGKHVPYDGLLLATGGRNRKLSIPGVDLPGVFSLRTVAECEAIKQAARKGSHAVVVGMGFIGSEVAASLRQLGVSVTAVFTEKGPLARVLGEEVGAVLAGIHREKGVELLPDDGVSAFTGDSRVEQVITRKGTRLGCDFAVVGAGIEPAVDILHGTPVAVDNGVVVDEMCRTSVGDVYAAGDVANHLHPILGRLRVEHYNNAERHGRAAARSMLSKGEPYTDIHSFWSDQYEHSIEYIGYARRWDELVMRGSLEERAFVGFYLEGGRVRAAVGLNRGGDPEADEEGELAAARILIREAAVVDKGQLADDKVDLRALAGGAARG